MPAGVKPPGTNISTSFTAEEVRILALVARKALRGESATDLLKRGPRGPKLCGKLIRLEKRLHLQVLRYEEHRRELRAQDAKFAQKHMTATPDPKDPQ
jgi:hypothetical protein